MRKAVCENQMYTKYGESDCILNEKRDKKVGEKFMRVMGIDIGTTTISVILLDSETGEIVDSRTISHQAFLKTENMNSRVQDPEKLYKLAKKAVMDISADYGKPDSIGFTGQMHGVLYVNGKGRAVSPLYTWQDSRGNEFYQKDCTYVQFLKKKIGNAAVGYGMTTHFYLHDKGEIADDAVWMTTISDYIAMRFCNKEKPVLARDMAASWGCFDTHKGDFFKEKLENLGISTKYLPEVCEGHKIIGNTMIKGIEGVPVMASLGDNQASFIGSVQNMQDTVLINIGTGSQVSFGTGFLDIKEGAIELRPCTADSCLLVGAGLCGGRAYAMLENFFNEIIVSAGFEYTESSLYSIMEKEACKFIQKYGIDDAWKIRTTFSGTRVDPEKKGSIEAISVDNFSMGAMTVGMLQGILDELWQMYQEMCRITGRKAIKLVGSGNGLRKNKLMQKMAEKLFGMKLYIPKCQEEAAYGAALHSLVSAGLKKSLKDVQYKIQYL